MKQDQEIIKAVTAEEIAAEKRRIENEEVEAAKPAPEFIGNKNRSVTILLEYPLAYDGIEYHEVTLSRVRGVDLQRVDEHEDQTLQLLHLVTGLPHKVIEALDAEDYAEINAVGADFLPRRLLQAAEQHLNSGQDTQLK